MQRSVKTILIFLMFVSHASRPANGHTQNGIALELKFEPEHGFYEQEIHVSISADTQYAAIHYTLDGSAPAITVGQSTLLYRNPIAINKTSIIRAMAVFSNGSTSDVMTQTYIFVDDVIQQDYQATRDAGFPGRWGSVTPDYGMDPDIVTDPDYGPRLKIALSSIPSISIVSNINDLFGPNGIYTNSEDTSKAWECPGSAELLFPDKSEGFQINCGIRIQGGWFRQHIGTKKHSLRLLFKTEYGHAKLHYPLFGDDAADRYDTIVLRAGANDGYAWDAARYTEQYTRDEFGRRLHALTGNVSPHGLFVHLYLNGIYWGLYNPVERPDDSFSAIYHGGDKSNWDAIDGGEITSGSADAWNQLLSKCRNGVSSLEDYLEIQGNNPDGTRNPDYPVLIDIQNYIDYMIVNMWGGNWDWPWKNYRMARDRTDASNGFQFYIWDYENTIGNNRERSPLDMDRVAGLGSMGLGVGEPHIYLMENENYRMLFADRVYRHFFNGGPFSPESLIDHYRELASEVELAIIPESARWGDMHHSDPLTLDDWYAERDWILGTYLPQRSDIVLDQFKQAGLYPDIDAPEFHVNNAIQHGGIITSADRISITGAEGKIYYTMDGSDPRLFSNSTTPPISPNAVEYLLPFTVTQTIWLKSRIYKNGKWSALNEAVFTIPSQLNGIVVSELHYHPLPQDGIDESEFEFIELYNAGSATQNLGMVRFDKGIHYIFPVNTIIQPDEYLVLASDNHYFNLRYGFSPFGTYSGQLDNGGERIVLLDASGDTLISFRYYDKQPWPESADGDGYSLVLETTGLNPDYDNPANWRASEKIHGEPGVRNVSVRDDKDISLPQKFALMQNYPNPFNSETIISFAVPQKALVSISFFNVMGQELKTLVHREFMPGHHVIEWDAGAFSDGVYFIRMKTNQYQSVIKAVLIK
jgi:hypothetical protein